MPDASESALQSERQLMNTQAGLAAMLEANQTALVGHMAALLAPIQLEMAELRTMLGGMHRQIEQMHERQEQLERTMMLPLRRTTERASAGEP